jgi:Protein of unknown function (DUF1566)
MNNRLNLIPRPSRFLKPGRSLLLLMLLVFCTAAFATPTTPTSDFIDNGDGTVTHKTTGLVWMRCSMGQTWDKATASCTGTAARYTWDAAMALKIDFAGKSDWRLPNIAELNTIVEWANYNPAINTTIFPNAPNEETFSSTLSAYNSRFPWFLSFYSGQNTFIFNDNQNYSFSVRLVRAGQSFSSLPLTTPTSDFIDNKDGTVKHKRTGLIWQRCTVGQKWTGATCLGSENRYTWNQAMALKSTFAGHNDWRIPNANEFLSIVEYGTYSAYSPAINRIIFPSIHGFWWYYWSSSPYAVDNNFALSAYFDFGSVESINKESYIGVLLVRGGQPSTSLPFSIAQSPLSGSTGDIFVQWGNGFTPNSTATLHIQKPDGTEYPTQQQALDTYGHFSINYPITANKPAGTYRWWLVDNSTGTKSQTIRYKIIPLKNIAKLYGTLHSNSNNGAALANVKVSVGLKSILTAKDGSFALNKIAAGQQIVTFSKIGYQPFSVTVSVPSSGAYNLGDRWLVQNGTVTPTIAQAPMVGLPGSTFVQWGTGFTRNGKATLHFKKPDGSEYPSVVVALDGLGHLEKSYTTPMDKPAGDYSWWAVDNASQKVSNTVTYTVMQPANVCTAPPDKGLMKINDATCMEQWNLTIFYKERYNGFLAARQSLIQKKIDGTLDANSYFNIALDLYSSIDSLKELPNLKNKNIKKLVGIGANQGMQLEGKASNNEMADIWYGLVGSWLESAATGNPMPVIEQSVTTSLGAVNNLFATIGVTALTKRFQEVEIAKQYLFEYYRNGSRFELLAASYGLPANAKMYNVITAIGKQIGATPHWFWGDAYNVYNVVDIIRAEESIVAMKQAEYSK